MPESSQGLGDARRRGKAGRGRSKEGRVQSYTLRDTDTHTHTHTHTRTRVCLCPHPAATGTSGKETMHPQDISVLPILKRLAQGHWTLPSGHISPEPSWLSWRPPASEICSPCPCSHHLSSWSEPTSLVPSLQRSMWPGEPPRRRCPGIWGHHLLTSS